VSSSVSNYSLASFASLLVLAVCAIPSNCSRVPKHIFFIGKGIFCSKEPSTGQRCDHLPHVESTIKPITKFRKISRQMSAAYRMIRTMQRTLDITKHDIDPGKCRDLHAFITTTGNDRFMKDSGISNTFKTGQSVGENKAVLVNVFGGN
jgi:hypothetical protein